MAELNFNREERSAQAVGIRQFDIDGRSVDIFTFASNEGVVTPKWEYFSDEELKEHAGKFALIDTTYDQFVRVIACKIEDWVDVCTGWDEAEEVFPITSAGPSA